MTKFIIAALIIVSSLLGLAFFDAEMNSIRMEKSLDSIIAERDELAYVQKMMMVSYPQITKWEAKYYSYIFKDFSDTYNVPASTLVALIAIESGWNPVALSPANCKGLGQLSSAAAIDECKKLGIKYKQNNTEWNEILNLVISLNRFCSRYESEGRDYAIKSYVGGDAYNKNNSYIKEYTKIVENEDVKIKNILHESNKLMYIYRGVIYEYEHAKDSAIVQRVVHQNNPTINLIKENQK